jgi:hypothetical protein
MALFRNMSSGGCSQYGNIPCDISSAKQSYENAILEGNYDHLPRTVNNKANTLAFGGWEFDIRRTVYPTANIEQIFDGWNSLVAVKIPMDLLFLSLFLKELFCNNTITTEHNSKCNILDQKKISKEEPELVALLRLCYWYHRCLQINDRMQDNYFNFNDKLKEIKEELGQKTKAKARNYGLPILADYGSNMANYHTQLQSVITDTMRNENKKDKASGGILDDIRYSIYRFLSECIFYTLVSEAGFEVQYGKIYSKRPPKLDVEGIPSAFRILLDEQIQGYELETITRIDNLNEEILHILKQNRRLVDKINDALEEGLFVILDTTGTLLGHIINLYAQSQQNRKQINQSIRKSVRKAVDMMFGYVSSKGYLPIIFLAQTHDNLHNFRISAITVGVPCSVNDEEDGFEVNVSKLPE